MGLRFEYREVVALSAIPKSCGLEAATQTLQRLSNGDARGLAQTHNPVPRQNRMDAAGMSQ